MEARDQVASAYEKDRRDVYGYLVMLGLPPEQAQEATQEVYLRMHVAVGRGEVLRNPRAWAFRVAHNLGLTLREKDAASQGLPPEAEARVPDGRRSPERQAIENQRQAALREALETLSPQQKRCLYLRAEGLKYAEIAEATGISISSVNEFVSRALARLRKAVHGT